MKFLTKCLGIMLAMAMPLCAGAQNVTVKGQVKDATGEPVISANVAQVGTTNGTVTDFDGNYSLTVPANATLQFSFIGYTTQTVKVNGRSTINVTLEEDAELLEDVVIIGYGSVKKSDISGSVASVDMEQALKKAPINIGQMLQGSTPGVQVSQQDGSPEGKSAIRIRGVGTINGTADPLYVVDGVQVGTDANFVNPSDIESIEVLKDASATAIYGSAGANGVIMITTKHGKNGTSYVNVTADFGIQTLPYKLETLDVDTYAAMIREARANDGNSIYNQVWDARFDGKRNSIDWQDQMTQNGVKQQYGVSVGGGNDKTQYSASLGWLDNDGLIVNSNYQRMTARFNVNSKITKYLEIGADINYVHSETHGSNTAFNNNLNLSSLRDLAYMAPTLDYLTNNDINGELVNVNVVNPDGTYGVTYQSTSDGWEGFTMNAGNIYATQMETGERARNGSDKIMLNAHTNLTLLNTTHHKIDFKTIASMSYWGSQSSDMTGGRSRYNYIGGVLQEITLNADQELAFSMNQSSGYTYGIQNYITYAMNIGDHSLTLMAGNDVSKSSGQWVSTSAKDFISVQNRATSLSLDPSRTEGSGAYNADVSSISYYGRAIYSLMDRYILTATVRRDGSSNFGAGNRWGTFPSAALAWKISEENFMQGVEAVNNLKLRAGWGQTGNAGNMTGKAIAALSSSGVAYNYYPGTENSLGAFAGTRDRQSGLISPLVDTNLKWETNEQTNIGIDLGLLDNRFTATIDYYIRTSKDLLLYQQTRPSTGYSSVYTNFGSIENKGYEFTLGYKEQLNKDWSINATFTGQSNHNEVIEMGEPLYYTNGSATGDGSNVGAVGAAAGFHWGNHSISTEGEAVGSYYGYKVGGIIETIEPLEDGYYLINGSIRYKDANCSSTQVGDWYFLDQTDDDLINEDDMCILGNGFAKFNYGLTLGANYKNWDFSVYMYGELGKKIYSYSAMRLSNIFSADDQTTPNILKSSYDAAYRNGEGSLPRLSLLDGNYNMRASDAWVKNGNFLRISNIQVGYSLPKNIIKNYLQAARVYVAIQNLAVFSPYKQYGDPECGQGSVLCTGLDTGRYPMPRTFTAGLSVTF